MTGGYSDFGDSEKVGNKVRATRKKELMAQERSPWPVTHREKDLLHLNYFFKKGTTDVFVASRYFSVKRRFHSTSDVIGQLILAPLLSAQGRQELAARHFWEGAGTQGRGVCPMADTLFLGTSEWAWGVHSRVPWFTILSFQGSISL